jgi:hypothetical protein
MSKKEDKIMEVNTNVPEFLRNMKGNRGSEDVAHEDLIIPRIEIVQSLSKVRKKNAPEYIEGIEEGMLYNSVTRKNYGTSIEIVPVVFKREYILWRDQKLGGGFGGAFPSMEEAEEVRATLEKPEEWEAVLTHQHFCLVKEENTWGEAVISMAKSKLKVSKIFNSLVRINGGDRFSRRYKLTGVLTENKNGQEFYTFKVINLGYVDEPTYRKAEGVYKLIMAGAATADRSYDGMDTDTEEGPEF